MYRKKVFTAIIVFSIFANFITTNATDAMIENQINENSSNIISNMPKEENLNSNEESTRENTEENKSQNQNLIQKSATSKASSNGSTFLSQKGFFYIQISGNGKTTKRKIQVTLSSKDRTKEQTITFSDISSGSRIS